MSPRPVADCEACRDALTELVCDELDRETRTAVLAHAQGCARCTAELARLRAVMQLADGMPAEAPSPRVHAAIMLAAREAQARRAALKPADADRDPDGDGLARFVAWLTRLGTWAMSPQVAMASVLLLMLGIGLVAVPLGEEREPTALRVADEAVAPPPAAATAAASPARSAPSEDESSPLDTLAESAGENATGAPRSTLADDVGQDTKRARESKGGGALAARRERAAAPARDTLAGAQKAESLEAVSAAKRSRPAQAFPGTDALGAAASGEASKSFAAAPAAEPAAQAAPAGGALGEVQPSDASPEAQLLEQGIRAARSGDHAGAIAVLKPLAAKAAPGVRKQAALWLARSYRASDDCASALRYYGPMVAGTAAPADVLNEAADCYARTGEGKQAAALRARAVASSPVKARAAKPAAAKPAADANDAF